MDATWLFRAGDSGLIVDPWLVGSEIDGFRWFNEQWHATPPVPPEKVEGYTAVAVSQSYTDHCHRPTLEALRPVPLLATPKAAARLAKELPGRELTVLPNAVDGGWHSLGALEVAYLDPGRRMDPVYYGLIIRDGDQAAGYFPHGFTLTPAQLSALDGLSFDAVVTSFSLFQLPSFLGGAVNPGIEAGIRLVEQLGPRHVFQTHDEQKHGRGLVKRIARTIYPPADTLSRRTGGRFVDLDASYQPFEL